MLSYRHTGNQICYTNTQLIYNSTSNRIPQNISAGLRSTCPGVNNSFHFTLSKTTYPGFYMCKSAVISDQIICISEDDICDGQPHCPHLEDELGCTGTCPEGCSYCSRGKYRCHPEALPYIPWNANYIDLSGYDVSGEDLRGIQRLLLTSLVLSKCNMSNIDILMQNDIFPYLRFIDASYNQLRVINTFSSGYRRTTKLILDGNPITKITRLNKWEELSLRNASIQNIVITKDPLSGVYTKMLFVNSYFSTSQNSAFDSYDCAVTSLDVSHNSLRSIDFLVHCIYLEKVNMSYNQVDDLSHSSIHYLFALEKLDLRYNQIKTIISSHFSGLNEEENFVDMPVLRVLILRGNRISFIENFKSTPNLQYLDIGFNILKRLNANTFVGLYSLKMLNLQDNLLYHIPSELFRDLANLRQLYLKNNRITSIPDEAFVTLSLLQTMDISGNDISAHEKMFGGLGILKLLYVKHHVLCCVRPKSVPIKDCKTDISSHMSCSYLVSSAFLSICIWFLLTVVLVVNTLCFIKTLKPISTVKTSQIHAYLASIHLSDILYGLYLLIIGTSDVISKGSYSLYHDSWLNNAWCKAAGVIMVISNDSSLLTSMIFALKYKVSFLKNQNMTRSVILISVVWSFSMIHAILPLTADVLHPFKIYGNPASSTCAPLSLTSNIAASEQRNIIVSYFACPGVITCVIIITIYSWRFLFNPRYHHTNQRADTVLISSNSLSWIPTLVLGNFDIDNTVIPAIFEFSTKATIEK